MENASPASNLAQLGPGELVGQGLSQGEPGVGVSVSYSYRGFDGGSWHRKRQGNRILKDAYL